MSSDIPAEFLPALPAQRNRQSVGTRDARVESMMAAMQQRPPSVREGGSTDGRARSIRAPSVGEASRTPSMDRPASVRSAAAPSSDRRVSFQSTASDRQYPPLVLAEPEEVRRFSMDRPISAATQPSQADLADRPQSVASNHSRGGARVEPAELLLPIAMARIETADDDVLPMSSKRGDHHPSFLRSFSNPAGNRDTLTLTDEELARRLHEQMNSSSSFREGQIVTAEIVQQEVVDRRNAEQVLDDEIANLESAVMARQLENPDAAMDGGQAEDDAFRAALALNDKLDYMRPTSHKPYFSLFILTITTVAMAAEIALNGGVEPFSVNPTFGPKPEILLQIGAKRTDLILGGEWWRLFTPVILHAGILHLLFNMLGLWNIGVPMEREFGSWKIMLIYVASGFFGVLMSCLFAPTLTSVGASGAIFGLFGAAWADLIQNWSLYKGSQIRMLIQLLLMTTFNIVLGLMPFLDNYAHLGGLVCGCVIGLGVLVQTRYYYSGVKKGKRTYQIILMVLSLLLLPALFVAGYCVLFLQGPVDCDWCTFISCVPMPPNVPVAERWWSCDECSQGGLTGDVGANNTLIFTCPNNGEGKSIPIPLDVTINTAVLIETCIAECLS